jgi:hypothetical protein
MEKGRLVAANCNCDAPLTAEASTTTSHSCRRLPWLWVARSPVPQCVCGAECSDARQHLVELPPPSGATGKHGKSGPKRAKWADKHDLVQKRGFTGLDVNGSCRASPPCLVFCLGPYKSRPVRARIPGQKTCFEPGFRALCTSISAGHGTLASCYCSHRKCQFHCTNRREK